MVSYSATDRKLPPKRELCSGIQIPYSKFQSAPGYEEADGRRERLSDSGGQVEQLLLRAGKHFRNILLRVRNLIPEMRLTSNRHRYRNKPLQEFALLEWLNSLPERERIDLVVLVASRMALRRSIVNVSGAPKHAHMRNPNTKTSGGSFDSATVEAVWKKARPVSGRPEYATDTCGTLIARSSYGQTTDHAWEIDHIKPVAKGGGDELSNLQPLQWRTNRQKGDQYPWFC